MVRLDDDSNEQLTDLATVEKKTGFLVFCCVFYSFYYFNMLSCCPRSVSTTQSIKLRPENLGEHV